MCIGNEWINWKAADLVAPRNFTVSHNCQKIHGCTKSSENSLEIRKKNYISEGNWQTIIDGLLKKLTSNRRRKTDKAAAFSHTFLVFEPKNHRKDLNNLENKIL